MLAQRKQKSKKSDNFIKFLGTAGARFVMIRQLRSSGGLWISVNGTNVLVDPGPGSLVRCASARPKLDPTKLDAIILTHRHLDHSNDINVMAEAMTEGGFKKKGVLFVPSDTINVDSLILQHMRVSVAGIEILKEETAYSVGNFSFTTGPKNMHPVETYGFKFQVGNQRISLIADTAMYPELIDYYAGDIVIINVVFAEPRPGIQHLCLSEARELIAALKPKKAILTHFGMTMLKAKPHEISQRLTQELQTEVVAAYDGMTLQL